MSGTRVAVVVETPRHAGMGDALEYLGDTAPPAGTLVRVPLGRRSVAGIVWAASPQPVNEAALRPIEQVLDAIPPLNRAWMALVEFAAGYYQRSVGELALGVLPPELRRLDASQLAQRVRRARRSLQPAGDEAGGDGGAARASTVSAPPLTAEQAAAVKAIESVALATAGRPVLATSAQPTVATAAAEEPVGATGPQSPAVAAATTAHPPSPLLLHGVTGSGKTEVYLRAAEHALARGRQVLMLVPEINLTPQLLARVEQRFPARRVVALHSALTPAQRLRIWLLAHLGEADVVLGTRLAVLASLPRLGLIVVDEEHDASYKQQEGARYSARDLAVYRGRLEGVPVVLGSATPSLETWQHVATGRYRRLEMAQRIGGAVLPRVRVFDMHTVPRTPGQPPPALAAPVLQALRERLARNEQSVVFLNRRGYAPVLHCLDCGWQSECAHCSAWRVFHKLDRTLRCHHCGLTEPVPRACPACGNLDIQPVGRGTERLAEQLAHELPTARIVRLDADATRGKGALESALATVHAGEVDIVVGTQMVAKGHDFRRVTLVVAVNPDTALFSSDFRAGERQFALLMQAAGRAGRDAEQATGGEMWLQTWHPRHALYAALRAHDYAAYAEQLLRERRSAGLPPFAHLALLRAEARDAAVAQAFLHRAAEVAAALPEADGAMVYPPVPPAVARVAGIERMQMLIESASRTRLQRLLSAWLPLLHAQRREFKGLARWAVDVDPGAI